jgi:hypothetical protein
MMGKGIPAMHGTMMLEATLILLAEMGRLGQVNMWNMQSLWTGL